MNYGRAIKIARTAYGLTQSALAKRLSIGTSQLSLIEAGKRQPSLGVIFRRSLMVFNVPMHLLTLLASRPEDLSDEADPKQVAELADALLRLLVRVGEQGTLPLDGQDEEEGHEEEVGMMARVSFLARPRVAARHCRSTSCRRSPADTEGFYREFAKEAPGPAG